MSTPSLSAPTFPSITTTTSSSQEPPATSSVADASNDETKSGPPSITQALAQLKHERKNQTLVRLPPTHTITRRPIIHAPIASPFARSGAQKVVYVSSKTPLMSAVKRVRKFLHEIEKRAMQDVKLVERGEREGMKRLAESKDRLAKEKEQVLVKASGRAMGKAIAVGKWFEETEKEWQVGVEVRSGSVSVVDDIVEVEREKSGDDDGGDVNEEDGECELEVAVEETRIEGGDTTMELFGLNEEKSTFETRCENTGQGDGGTERGGNDKSQAMPATETSVPAAAQKPKRKRNRRKKRKTCDEDNVSEQRLRWVKTMEVAISLKV